MSTDPEVPKTSPDDATAIQQAAQAEVNEPRLAASAEPEVAEPPSEVPPPQPPPSFERLKAYCDGHGIKCAIETDEPQFMAIEFRNGRKTRAVYAGPGEPAEALLQYPLEDLVFLGEYAAICSYKAGWIEAAIRPHGVGPRSFLARRIFDLSGKRVGEEPAEIEIGGPAGLTLRLTERRGCLYYLDYPAPLYLRIEGIGITEHDKATNLLEDLSNSLFLQIDLRFDSPLTIAKERFPLRRKRGPTGKLDEDTQLVFPRYSFDSTPSSLYWYGRSASSMPLLQFLAFYQCLEFFFPQYSRQEAIAKIKNVLKDPSFDGTKDSSINAILNATMEGRRGYLVEERKQLGATLKHCIDAIALRDFLHETDDRKHFYEEDYRKISAKRISFSEDAPIVEQTADRIYDIRCKVVHTKNLEGSEGEEMILPFSKEEDLLVDDVQLIRFLAQKVLIASSVPLRL